MCLSGGRHKSGIRAYCLLIFFFQAEDGIRDIGVTGVQTCALPISSRLSSLSVATGAFYPARRTALAPKAVATTSAAGKPSARERLERLARPPTSAGPTDRKSVVEGKSGALGGRRFI